MRIHGQLSNAVDSKPSVQVILDKMKTRWLAITLTKGNQIGKIKK